MKPLLSVYLKYYYALVICNHGPYGAGDSGGIAGLKYQDFTFEVSRQCRGKAGLLIPAKTAGEIAGRFDRGLPVYSTVFYPNFGRVLKYCLLKIDCRHTYFISCHALYHGVYKLGCHRFSRS